jgi:hypothetical protein
MVTGPMKEEVAGTWRRLHNNHSEYLDIDDRIIVEWILGKYGTKTWTGCIQLRLGTSCELLGTR